MRVLALAWKGADVYQTTPEFLLKASGLLPVVSQDGWGRVVGGAHEEVFRGAFEGVGRASAHSALSA